MNNILAALKTFFKNKWVKFALVSAIYLLIFVVFAALLQHFVHKRGLTVIDVCDYRNVAQICSYQKYLSVSFLYFCLF